MAFNHLDKFHFFTTVITTNVTIYFNTGICILTTCIILFQMTKLTQCRKPAKKNTL